MILSFRLRLTVLISFLTAIVLVLFSLGAWWKIRDAKMAALESEMRAILQREIAHPHPLNEWQHIYQTLTFQLTGGSAENLHLIAIDSDNTIRFNSTALSPDKIALLPWGTLNAQMQMLPRPLNDFNTAAMPPPPPPQIYFTHITLQNVNWYAGFAITARPRLALAVSESFIAQQMQPVRDALFISIPFALLLLGGIAWWLSYRALQPILLLTQSVAKISAQDLHARIDIASSDRECAELITSINELFNRLEKSFHQALRFSGDAAHELKTPLAIIQGQLEQAIQAHDTAPEVQTTLMTLLDESRRLSVILRKLLLLSQADAGKLYLHKTLFLISEELALLVEDAQLLAPHLTMHTHIRPNLTLLADADLLRQGLQNIIGNAIKYNVQHGNITVSANTTSHHIVMVINNTSHGITDRDAPHIFDRFYRGDAAHNRTIDGSGLGLSLAREIIQAHDGTITLSMHTAQETGFTILLPINNSSS